MAPSYPPASSGRPGHWGAHVTLVPISPRPPTWDLFAHALRERRTVRASYHGADRLLCPHALGWKNGRPKLLAYQIAGSTSHGPLPAEPQQRWRSMFVDEIEAAVFADEPWGTADNYSLSTNAIDQVELALAP
jgi:hypothetical protein